MKVRVNGKLYDSDNEPILLMLSSSEKEIIRSLKKDELILTPSKWEEPAEDGR